MKLVFDTSTLILLAKIDVLRDVSRQLTIIIPEEVRREALSKQSFDAELIRRMIEEHLIEIMSAGDSVGIQNIINSFRIHAGEAEALNLAKKLDLPLAVDDGPTIKACKVLGHRFVTAVHFLIHLSETNLLERKLALEKLSKLSQFGRYKPVILEDAAVRIKGGQ